MQLTSFPAPHCKPLATLTIDLEDWYQLVARKAIGTWPPASERVLYQTDRLLALLREHGLRATFFVLATVAQRFPQLIRQLRQEGHEIASHGSDHIALTNLNKSQVRDDLSRSIQTLEDVTGEKVLGYRAPQFSVTRRNLEALEVMAELGLLYDSSIFPIRHRRFGIVDFPRHVTQMVLPSGRTLWELPLTTMRWRGQNFPVAGGGWFRLLPGHLLEGAIRSSIADGVLPTLYFHPYEFDDAPLVHGPPAPRQRAPFHWLWYHSQNLRRHTIPSKLTPILKSLQFVTCQEALMICGKAQPSATAIESEKGDTQR